MRLWGHKETVVAELRGEMKEKVVRMLGEEYLLPFMDIPVMRGEMARHTLAIFRPLVPTYLIIMDFPCNHLPSLNWSSHFLHYLSLASWAGVDCVHVWVTFWMSAVN